MANRSIKNAQQNHYGICRVVYLLKSRSVPMKKFSDFSDKKEDCRFADAYYMQSLRTEQITDMTLYSQLFR